MVPRDRLIGSRNLFQDFAAPATPMNAKEQTRAKTHVQACVDSPYINPGESPIHQVGKHDQDGVRACEYGTEVPHACSPVPARDQGEHSPAIHVVHENEHLEKPRNRKEGHQECVNHDRHGFFVLIEIHTIAYVHRADRYLKKYPRKPRRAGNLVEILLHGVPS